MADVGWRWAMADRWRRQRLHRRSGKIFADVSMTSPDVTMHTIVSRRHRPARTVSVVGVLLHHGAAGYWIMYAGCISHI